MLVECERYMSETAAAAGAFALGKQAAVRGVQHDDSVNQRTDDSKLNRSWKETKRLWQETFGADNNDANTNDNEQQQQVGIEDGATYRGEPPNWWFHAGKDVLRVQDGFLTQAQVKACLEQLKSVDSVRAESRSGYDCAVQVDARTEARIREQLQDEQRAQQAAGDSDGGSCSGSVSECGGAVPTRSADGENTEQPTMVEIPARMCPSDKSVPLHKVTDCPTDRPTG